MSRHEESTSIEQYPHKGRRSFWQRVYNFTGTNFGGSNSPPLVGKTILKYDFHEDKSAWDGRAYSVITYVDDGHEIGFGYYNEWKQMISRKIFAKAVRRYIFIWAFYNWFGLRNWLYFKALHNIVNKRQEEQKAARVGRK